MRRKELYAEIVKLNLQDKVKEKYGVNYTNCRNEELMEVIAAANNINKTKAKKPVKDVKVEKACCADKKFDTLVHILKERHLLLASDVEKIMNA